MYITSAFTHNNGYDSILLPNGSTHELVTNDIFNDFASEPPNNHWDGHGDWQSLELPILDAAAHWGEPIAYYAVDANGENETLHIIDPDRWNERKDFYLGK